MSKQIIGELKVLPIGMIKVSEDAMREAKRDDEQYIQLRDNIQNSGLHSPICVVERRGMDGKVSHYEIADGVQRYSCFVDLQLGEIPCHIRDYNEQQLLLATMAGNLHRVDTKPIEYTKHLYRVIAASPDKSVSDLARELNTSVNFIMDRLSLRKLDERFHSLVNDKSISITNAIWLSRLPKEEQENWVSRAQTNSTAEFMAAAKARIDEIKKQNREGRAATAGVFTPTPHLVKASVLKNLLNNRNEIVKLINNSTEGGTLNTPIDGAEFILKHIFNVDEAGVAAAKAKFDAELAAKEAAKKAREEKKAKEAAEKTAALV